MATFGEVLKKLSGLSHATIGQHLVHAVNSPVTMKSMSAKIVSDLTVKAVVYPELELRAKVSIEFAGESRIHPSVQAEHRTKTILTSW